MKSSTIVLTGLLALLSPAGALAQGPAREPDASDLQRQLQEMRSQMDRMQSRIDELERAQANCGTNPHAQPAAQLAIDWARSHSLVRSGEYALLLRGQVAGEPRSRAVLAGEVP